MDRSALFNLADDLGEDHDLAATHPEVLAKLEALHAAWNGTLRKPVWIDSHRQYAVTERRRAQEAGTRQFPMPWVR